MRSARIADASTVSPSSQANECSLGFMVIWNAIAFVLSRDGMSRPLGSEA
jgi:hypothetical protein